MRRVAGERALRVVGAAEHNLREVDVEFGGGLTAVVGVSGSGRSSLAFDTVHHEARRPLPADAPRSGSAVAAEPSGSWCAGSTASVRAVAIEQNTLNRNPRSTRRPRRGCTLSCACCSPGSPR